MINSRLTIKVLATLQPRVPAPSSRHLADTIFSKSSVGTNRQHINFKLRSTDDSANLYHKINRNNVSECVLVLFFFCFNKAISYFNWGSFVVVVFKKEKEKCDRPFIMLSLLKAHTSSSDTLPFFCIWSPPSFGFPLFLLLMAMNPFYLVSKVIISLFQLTRSEIYCSTTFLLYNGIQVQQEHTTYGQIFWRHEWAKRRGRP